MQWVAECLSSMRTSLQRESSKLSTYNAGPYSTSSDGNLHVWLFRTHRKHIMSLFGFILLLLVAGGQALGILWAPGLAAGLTVAGLSLMAAVIWASEFPRWFLKINGILLCGYVFGGRGFAYLGVSPIYVGEVVLGFGFLMISASKCLRLALRSPISWLVIAFALWGLVRTLPFVGPYGVMAFRDAVLWGYGIFALLVAGSLLETGQVTDIPAKYWKVVRWFLLWAPLVFVISNLFGPSIPRILNENVPLLALKPGDIAVHLTGAAAFLALGLQQSIDSSSARSLWCKEWFLWLLWLVGFMLVACYSRGALTSFLVGASLVMLLRPFGRWMKAAAVGAILLSVLLILDLRIDLGAVRKISPSQMITNVESALGLLSNDPSGGSRQWRIKWWERIIDYTVYGDYFWTGKGFGINLADVDGFQVDADRSLRSPHNGHINILARSGVPGLALWVILQLAFCFGLVRGYFRARTPGRSLVGETPPLAARLLGCIYY